MRLLIAGVVVLFVVGLGTMLVVAACVGLGTGVARLLPMTLFQASLLCLFALVTFVVIVTRLVETITTMARAADAMIASGPADDSATEQDDMPAPSTSTTLTAVTTEVFKVSTLRPRQKTRRQSSPPARR